MGNKRSAHSCNIDVVGYLTQLSAVSDGHGLNKKDLLGKEERDFPFVCERNSNKKKGGSRKERK